MNIKMKTLSLAVLGLTGLAFAGMASAACGPANLSAWSATQAVGGTVTVATGGLEATTPSECRLDTSITANSGSAGAYVRDDTPANESRYRAQYLMNVDALTGLNSAQPVKLFVASTLTPSQTVPDVVTLTVYGNAAGTNKVLGIAVADTGSSVTGYRKAAVVPLTGITGTIRVEIDYVKSATGSLKVWVNNSVEASPNQTISVDNNAWGGVDSANLGLSGASSAYRAVQINKIVKFDKFDSRRQTFIGG